MHCMQVVHELQQLTKQDVVDFYSAHAPAGSKQRRRLTVHICSQQPQSDAHGVEGKSAKGKAEANGKSKVHQQHGQLVHERQVEVVDIERIKAGLRMQPLSSGKPPGLS